MSEYTANDIEVLEGLDAVRKRPLMYVGDLDAEGLADRMLSQAYCHAIDEALDGAAVTIKTELVSPTIAVVSYNVGIPLSVHPTSGHRVARIFLTLHAGCSNLKKHVSVGSEFCELGLAVLNALSEACEADIVSNGKAACYRFSRGCLEGEPEITSTDAAERTTLRIQLDAECLKGNVVFSVDRLRRITDPIASKIASLRFEFITTDH